MFKKTLAAVAVLGAFAGSALAANVTLYGIVDEALQYSYKNVQVGEKADTYGMKSGGQASSRWGLKGQEELGNGLVAGFVLENGFSADTGKLANGDRLFGRAASVYLNGGFGTIAAGHDGALASGVGTVSYIYQYAAMGTGWGDLAGSQNLFNFSYRDRADNAITYITPDLGGLKLYAQYSFEANGSEKEHSSDNNRYGALGAQYKAGPFSTGLVVDMLKKAGSDNEDQYTVSYGASYDFEVAKVYGMAQYGKHMDNAVKGLQGFYKNEKTGKFTDREDGLLQGDLEGWNLSLGASAPVLGGTVFAQVNYIDVKDKAEGSNDKLNGYGVAAAYSYPLSKRTSVYTYGAWSEFKNKGTYMAGEKSQMGEFGLGLTHKF